MKQTKILLANYKQKQSKRKKFYIYLNKNKGMKIDAKTGFRTIITGDSGAGKSYTLSIISDQFKNVIVFDPQQGARFRTETLNERGIEKYWKNYVLSSDPEAKKGNLLKFNIADAGIGVFNRIFQKKTFSSVLKEKKIKKIMPFFRMPSVAKEFRIFRKMLEDEGLTEYLQDFETVFDVNDRGVSIYDIQEGRIVIELDGISDQSLSLGIIVSMIIESRIEKRYTGSEQGYLVIVVDEAQDYTRRFTALGTAIAELATQARKFQIGYVLAGSVYKETDRGINLTARKQATHTLIFSSLKSIKQLNSEGYNFVKDDFVKGLGKHEFYFFDHARQEMGEDGGFVSVLADDYYLDLRRKEEEVRKEILVSNPFSFECKRILGHGFRY